MTTVTPSQTAIIFRQAAYYQATKGGCTETEGFVHSISGWPVAATSWNCSHRATPIFFSGKQVAVIILTLVCLTMIKEWLGLLPTCIFTLLQSFTNVLLEVNGVTIRSCLSWVSTFNKRKFVYLATCTIQQSPVFYKDLHSMIPGEAADSGPRLTFRTDTKTRTSRAERSPADLSASNRAPPESYMKAGSGYNCLVGWRSWTPGVMFPCPCVWMWMIQKPMSAYVTGMKQNPRVNSL